MKDKKEKRPDPKVLNAVVVAHKLAKGIYSKPEEEKNAEKSEKGTKDEKQLFLTLIIGKTMHDTLEEIVFFGITCFTLIMNDVSSVERSLIPIHLFCTIKHIYMNA